MGFDGTVSFTLDKSGMSQFDQLWRSTIVNVGKAVRDEAKRTVHVDTGELKRSIHIEEDPKGVSVIADADHASIEELRGGDHAYMRPSLFKVQGEISSGKRFT